MGKTTELLKWMREAPNRLFVTFSDLEANRLKNLPENEGFEKRILPWRVYAGNETASMGSPDKFEVAIDNLDLILQRYSRFPVKIISVTKE